MNKPRRLGLLAVACGGILAITACGGGSPGETTGTSNDAIHVTKWAAITQPNVQFLMGFLQIPSCTLTVSNGTGTFTPSANLAKMAYPLDPNPQDHLMTFQIPSFMVSTPNGIPTAWATFTSLTVDVTTVTATFEPTTFDVTATASGTVHLQMPAPWPNPDLQLEPFSLTMKIGIDPTGKIVGTVVPPTIGHNVTGCGVLDWCNGIVNSMVPDDLGALFASKMQDAVNTAFADPKSKAGLAGLLGSAYNGITNPGHTVQDWTVDAQTINIANSQVNFVVSHDEFPAAPTGCSGQQTCTGTVDVRCDMDPEVLELERMNLFAGWAVVGADANPNRSILPELLDPSMSNPPSWEKTAYYRVCAVNSAGTACGASFGVPVAAATGCGGGGGGGSGGFTGKGPGGWGIPTY